MNDSFNCRSSQAEVTEVSAGVTRRAALSAFAAALATVGLTSLSESAYAAAKTYNICKTTDVRVGSARMFSIGGRSIVVTQPKRGVFRAFAAECTHQGATLSKRPGTVRTIGSVMICPEHGARFNTTSGAAKGGPTSRALGKIKLTVVKTQVRVSF
jgi:nitrite reductase/ring-hydroxylating ferredoxin subunit